MRRPEFSDVTLQGDALLIQQIRLLHRSLDDELLILQLLLQPPDILLIPYSYRPQGENLRGLLLALWSTLVGLQPDSKLGVYL